MILSRKSKRRIIHFVSVIFLVVIVVVFIGILIIAFEIDLYDILTGTQKLEITVENKSDKTKDVYCYLLQNTETEMNITSVVIWTSGIFYLMKLKVLFLNIEP